MLRVLIFVYGLLLIPVTLQAEEVSTDFRQLYRLRNALVNRPESVIQEIDPKILQHHSFPGELHFFLAKAYLAQEKWQKALMHFRLSVEKQPDIAAYVLREMALAFESHTRVSAAIPIYQEIVSRYTQLPLVPAIRMKLAEAYHTTDLPVIAIFTLDGLLNTPLRLDALLTKGRYLMAIEQDEMAMDLFLELRNEVPPIMNDIEAELDQIAKRRPLPPKTPQERFEEAALFKKRGRFDLSLKTLLPLLKEGVEAQQKLNLLFEIGYCQFRSRQYREAIQSFQAFEIAGGNKEQALFWIAWSLLRSGAYEDARKRYLELISTFPASTHIPEAEYKLAIIAEELSETDPARTAYQNVIQRGSRFASDALWRLAWLEFSDHRYEEALGLIETLIARSDRNLPQYLYWKARIEDKRGNKKEADQIYQLLLQRFSEDYYGWLAQMQLGKGQQADLLASLFPQKAIAKHIPSTDIVFAPIPEAKNSSQSPKDEQNLEQTLLTAFEIYQEFQEKSTDFRYKGLEHLRRASHLFLLGLIDDAAMELEQIEIQNPKNQNFALWIAPLYLHTNHFHQALRLASNHLSLDLARKNPSLEIPAFRFAYPLTYQSIVETASLEVNPQIDPFLLYALMRTESHFNTQAISPVGALGIAQFMPETGQKIAYARHVLNFTPRMLFDPDTSIPFAAHYLSRLIDLFESKPVLAIAAYNAGETNVAQWLKKSGQRPMDEVVEMIDYTETRNYVKKVLTDYLRYRTLYQM